MHNFKDKILGLFKNVSFHFVPSPRLGEQAPEYDRNKADYLKWLNKVDILVEDSEQNIQESLKIRG